MTTGIVAISNNFAIGRDGKLPWHYSADLKFFKQTTMGGIIMMGAATWRSIGKPLPGRTSVVLSRSGNVEVPDGVTVRRNRSEIKEYIDTATDEVFVIGGASVFAELADLIDRWIVTRIPVDIDDADVFMDRDFLDGFELVEKREIGDGLIVEILQRRKK